MTFTQELKEVKVQKERKPLRFLQRMEKPAPRPPTPGVVVPPEVSCYPCQLPVNISILSNVP